MIRQKTDTGTIDKTLQKDVEQAGQLLKHLARQINADTHIQALAAKNINSPGKEIIHAEMVFLTEKQDNDVAIQRIKNWTGIKKQLNEGELFSGKISGNITINETLILNIQLYHFDHYPARRLSEAQKSLRIVVYDPSYEAQYKNGHLAREILAKDAAACLLINIQPVTEIEEEQQLKINGLYTQHLHLGDLGTSITALFEDEALHHKIRVARLKNHIRYMDMVYRLVLNDIKNKSQQLQGKAMLNHKKQWQHQQKDTELSSKDVTNLKAAINNQLKQATKTVEHAIDSFDKEDRRYVELEKEIQSFFGFVEHKSGKYLSFNMAEGAVQDKVNKANTALKSFFEGTVLTANESFHEAETGIKDQLHTWKLQSTEQLITPDKIDPLSEEFLLDSSVASGKSYEKQVPAKGIGSLLMELRTPLFMLMPFMMIFMLFNTLVKGKDEGEVSSKQFHNDRRSVAITRLPESQNNQYLDFINQVEKQREKGLFDKEFNDNLTKEPQLATIEEEVQGIGNKTKIEERLDYDFDENAQILYLYLNENADREFVIEKLKSPAAKLLVVPASGGGGMGMRGIIKVMAGLTEYRYLILVGLSALISWFIITRKRGMDKELRTLKEKEQKKLNEDLKQHINKNIKQQLQRWKIKIIDQLTNRYMGLQQNVEDLFNKTIENNKQKKAQEYNIIQKRLTATKSERTLLAAVKSDRRKFDSKLGELKSKAVRLT